MLRALDRRRAAPARPRNRRLRGVAIPLFLLHWGITAAVVVSLVTGFRIAADAPDAQITRWLDPVLPQGAVFNWHLVSAYTLGFATLAYLVWLGISGQWRRLLPVRRNPGQEEPMPRRVRRHRFALQVIWLGLVLLIAALVSGTWLYLGAGGIAPSRLSTVHRLIAWTFVGFIAVHVVAHLAAAGWRPFVRMLQPNPRGWVSGALALGLAAGGIAGLIRLDATAIRALPIPHVTEGPSIDGSKQDRVWRALPATHVTTYGGANLAEGTGRGTTEVAVRAVHDGAYAYFLVEWADPTRSRKHWPLLKTEAGWRVLNEGLMENDEDRFYEDKFSIMLSRGSEIAGDGSIHLGSDPLDAHPEPSGGRGLHYTKPGERVDIWHWKSVRTDPLGKADDQYFGRPKPSRSEWKRYKGGYRPDVICEHPLLYKERDWTPNPACSVGAVYNWPHGKPSVQTHPRRLPLDDGRLRHRSSFDLSPDVSDRGFGFLRWSETVPYSANRDTYPVGTLMPSVLLVGHLAEDRADVDAKGQWRRGRWVLEMRRRLVTDSDHDVPIADGIHLWVAVFDHTQTRHTYHLKPLRLRLEAPSS